MPKRGPAISPKIRELITLRALEEPRIPRDAVAIHLIDEIEHMGLISPSEDTIIKMISRARNSAPNPLDKPWSIGASSKYYLPPDIIPVLIDIQKLQLRSEFEEAREPITIRQAQWIARLYPLIMEIHIRKYSIQLDEFKKPVDKQHLWAVYVASNMYARMEKMKEIVGEDSQDTAYLDEEFFVTERFWDMTYSDRAVHYAASRDLYKTVLKDYGHERAKQHRNENNF